MSWRSIGSSKATAVLGATWHRALSDRRAGFRLRLSAVVALVAALNVGGWIWALAAFEGQPVLLGIAFLVYGLGLRHAVDADHIAAIDNVTRKLMQEHQRPVFVGFFFAVGHSAVVIIVTIAIAKAASKLDAFDAYRGVGAIISTAISAFFLLAIAALNGAIFVSVLKAWRRLRCGQASNIDDLNVLLSGGIVTRCLRPLFRMISQSWHMMPLGFLFGLGFDTATEVAMFSLSAAQASKGAAIETILVFPLLFAAGMALVDTADGVVMLGAYEWALLNPIRKVYYNMTITLISVLVALLIGGIQLVSLIGEAMPLEGILWQAVGILGANFNAIGLVVVALFLTSWGASFTVGKLRRTDAAGSHPGR